MKAVSKQRRFSKLIHSSRCIHPLLLIALCLCVGGYAFADEVGEYDLKAALLVKVSAFVAWPVTRDPSSELVDTPNGETRTASDKQVAEGEKADDADVAAQEHFCIGIIGDDPFGPAFDALLAKADTARRTMTVRRVSSASEAAECQVVFIAPSARPQAAEILSALQGAVLTVADFPGFAVAGGMVEMTLEGKRISLTINRASVTRAGLSVSSKLMSLAHVIDGADEAAANAVP